MRRSILLLSLIHCLALNASAQELPSAEQILENVRFEIPQFRDAPLELGEIAETSTPGLFEASLTVAVGQSYRILLAGGMMYILAADPIDISRSAIELAQLLEEEQEEMARLAEERDQELTRFSAGMPLRGRADAPVAIYEFSDFQCPFCARGFATIEQLLDKYPDDVSFVYLHMPLDMHDWAKPAAIASVCAASQDEGAFWALHDNYFRNQQEITTENLLEKSRGFLDGTSLDMDLWTACASDESSAAYRGAMVQVEASLELASSYGLTGTPSFFVNGQFLSGIQTLQVFEALVEQFAGQ